MSALIEFWAKCEFSNPPFVHEDDLRYAKKHGLAAFSERDSYDFDGFVASNRFGETKGLAFHLSLVPSPYAGSLSSAKIFLVQLNPGFEYTDYYAEYERPEFRKKVVETLRQEVGAFEFPFIFLDPKFCWHSGFRYWERKLRKIIEFLAIKRGCSYLDAMREMSNQLATLELFSYHSQNFDHRSFEKTWLLPSVQQMRRFIEETKNRALNGEVTLIVIRKGKGLGIEQSWPNVVVFESRQAQGAHLTITNELKGPGGAILRQLGIRGA